MSHLIIKDIDQVFTPAGEKWGKTWHGLETQCENGITVESVKDCFCPIVQCGLKPDFETAVSTVPADLQNDCDLSQFKLIMADCRNGLSKAVHPLYVPKKGYVIHQNKALFDSMVSAADKVLGQDGYQIVTVGTLGGYSQFFVSIAIKGDNSFSVGKLENGAADVWDKFFNLNSSHNGLIASNVMLSTVRIVCMNTVQMSISDAEQGGTISVIKHTQNSEELITPETFEANLNLWLTKSESFQAALSACKAASMQIDDFKVFAAGVFTNPKSDELSTVSFNRIESMSTLFSKGAGNSGNSRYDSLNAFTEYFTHGDADTTMSVNKRVAMANFGRGNDWKQEAMKCLTNEELFSDCIKRGNMLYSDKLAANAAGN